MQIIAMLAVVSMASFTAPDLTKLDPGRVRKLEPEKIAWVADGKATLPIVCGGTYSNKAARSGRWRQPEGRAAKWLADAVKAMTGVKVEPVCLMKGEMPPKGPAIFIGDLFAQAAGVECPDAMKGAFRVVSKDGSLYFCGKADYAVYDFAERVLGVRHYWETSDRGLSVVKTPKIALPEIDYGDEPVFPMRYF